VLRPRTVRELFILGAAAISPMAVYALERANNDLAVFLLVICSAIVFTAPRPFRLFSYGLFVAAGLLKYYPLVLLIFVARERRRDALVTAVATGCALILFGVAFYPELKTALTSIPAASSYFTDAFSAWNLPFGFAEALAGGAWRVLIAGSLVAALSGVAVARTLRTVRLLGREQLDWAAGETQFLVIGGLLVAACFFAGQNIAYRGILPSSPGIVRAGLPPSIGQRPGGRTLLRPDDRGGALRHVGGVLPARAPRHDLPGPRRGAELARRGVLLARPGAGVVVAGCRARRARFVVPAAIADTAG
jgi:hypothetical protein